MYIHIYIHTYICIYIYIHTHIYVYTYIYTHIYVYTYIYTHIYVYTYVYIHTYVCIYVLFQILLPYKLLCCLCVISCVQLFATPWTVAHQAPLSMGFSRQEYWSGLPFPAPGDLSDSGIKPGSPASPSLAGGFFTTALLGKPHRLL